MSNENSKGLRKTVSRQNKNLLTLPFLAIAHRGASAYAPENTMAAFDLAFRMGADMIELDVQFSSDNVPMVFHDSVLDIHTDGKGAFSNFTAKELLTMDAGKWFSFKFESERIPTLSQVLQWSADKFPVNIEIKSNRLGEQVNRSHMEAVARLITSHGMESRVILSSFNYEWIEGFKQRMPDVLTGLLFNRHHKERGGPMHLLERFGADLFHCSSHEMKSSWINELNEAGRKFMIYTVNRRKGVFKWLKKGAHGIFSDKPDLLVKSAEAFFERN